MGLNPFGFSKSKYEPNYQPDDNLRPKFEDTKFPKLPNPDPSNFEVVRFREMGEYTIVEIKYPDCTNYEGRKIMVFETKILVKLLKKKCIDPHFYPNYGPVARFVPTKKGWGMAIKLCELINRELL